MPNDATTGANHTPPATTAPGRPTPKPARQLLEQSFNDGNFELAEQLIAADAVNHDPAEPAELRALRETEVLKRTVRVYRTGFPDVRITVDNVIAAGDKVVLRWHSEGTHRGELAGLAPTGARGSVTGISIDQWKDGEVVELGGMGQPRSRPPARRCAARGQLRREARDGCATPDGSLDAQEEPDLESGDRRERPRASAIGATTVRRSRPQATRYQGSRQASGRPRS